MRKAASRRSQSLCLTLSILSFDFGFLSANRKAWQELHDTIEVLQELNFELTPMAISAKVTNAPRVNAEFIMDCIGYRSWFPELVIGDECERGKPELPDMAWHVDECGRVKFALRSLLSKETRPVPLRDCDEALGCPT